MNVRTVRDGDEPAIAELFNEAYGKYGGFVPRTAEYWRWCCLERPDVNKDGIFLAYEDDKLCGYTVVGSSGNIWEFCVAENNKEAAEALMFQALNYLEQFGVSYVNVSIPMDAGYADILRKVGFGEVPAKEMFVTTLSPAKLIEALVTSKRDFFAKLEEDFGFKLREVPFGVSEEFLVKIHEASVCVAEGSAPNPSVYVELGFQDFLSILFNHSSLTRLFLSGKMKIKPLRKASSVFSFLSNLRLTNSWFFPLSDFI